MATQVKDIEFKLASRIRPPYSLIIEMPHSYEDRLSHPQLAEHQMSGLTVSFNMNGRYCPKDDASLDEKQKTKVLDAMLNHPDLGNDFVIYDPSTEPAPTMTQGEMEKMVMEKAEKIALERLKTLKDGEK